MWPALEITLDVATAVSIIGAASAFILQQRSQKRGDREDAKWALFRELADKLAEFKNQIVQEVLVVHGSLHNQTGEMTEEQKKEMVSLATIARTTLSSAYYYANYDLRLKVEAIARHYDDPGLKHIPDMIESFLKSMTDVKIRFRNSHKAYVGLELHVSDYYDKMFLRDMGFRLQGDPPDFEQSHGKDLDKVGKKIEEYHYTPRRYIKKEDQPPTAFEVLDGFFESMLGKS